MSRKYNNCQGFNCYRFWQEYGNSVCPCMNTIGTLTHWTTIVRTMQLENRQNCHAAYSMLMHSMLLYTTSPTTLLLNHLVKLSHSNVMKDSSIPNHTNAEMYHPGRVQTGDKIKTNQSSRAKIASGLAIAMPKVRFTIRQQRLLFAPPL